jgi:hypothetical protein
LSQTPHSRVARTGRTRARSASVTAEV